MTLEQMGLNEWLLIVGTLFGPIAAVQAQKWVERARESGNRKKFVFYQLMATRGARLSPDHVRALNSIDLVFYGVRIFGRTWRGNGATRVIDAWKEYHSHLDLPKEKRPVSEHEMTAWNAKSDELLVNLLAQMAAATSHEFDRATLRDRRYETVAQETRENIDNSIRRFQLQVLEGQRSLPLDIKSFPIDPALVEREAAWKKEFLETLKAIAQTMEKK